MKAIIIFFIFSFSVAYSQEVINIEDKAIGLKPNKYYKDVNNLLNYFEGTWLFTSGSTSLKVVFEKKTQYYRPEYNNYIDYLIGEYEYVENGTTIVSTLNNLGNPTASIHDHGISGNFIVYKNFSFYTEVGPSLIIRLEFKDFDRAYVDTRCLLEFANGNPDQIKLKLVDDNNIIPYEGAPMEVRVPLGEYILTKQ